MVNREVVKYDKEYSAMEKVKVEQDNGDREFKIEEWQTWYWNEVPSWAFCTKIWNR